MVEVLVHRPSIPCQVLVNALTETENHHLICGAGGICACPTVGLGEISATSTYLVTLVVGHLDADAVILAVQLVVVGDIRDGVLIAQLVADILKRLVEIIDMVRKESASAGLFRHVL